MIDEKFKKALEERDLPKVRDMLCSRLALDHNVTGGMFNEYFEYAKSMAGENHLFEPHDGRTLSNENTEENFKLLLGQLSTNFSRERLERVLEIAKSVWSQEQISPKAKETGTESRESLAGSERILGERVISENEIHKNANESGRVVGENVRVVGEERILGERPLYDENEENDSHSRRRTSSGSRGTQQNSDINPVAVVAGVAIAAAVIVAGVVIFS